MRENRTYGSEGGEPGDRASLPLSLTDMTMSGSLVSVLVLRALRRCFKSNRSTYNTETQRTRSGQKTR